MGVEKRSNAYHDDELCCASSCSCSLSSVFLARLQSETTVEPIAQQQQIEKRLSPLRSSPNDLLVHAEMSTTRAYERAQFIRPQAVFVGSWRKQQPITVVAVLFWSRNFAIFRTI